MEVHEVGTKLSPVRMTSSGAQMPSPPSQLANNDCWLSATSPFGAQCAPLHVGEHSGRDEGFTTSGPSHGQVRISGGSLGRSQANVQAPVGVMGSGASGS